MWPESGAVKSGVLEAALEQGDELVTETITEAGRYLGYGLASVINLLNPERIVLGGGVIEAVGLLFDVAVEYARREALAAPCQAVEFTRAQNEQVRVRRLLNHFSPPPALAEVFPHARAEPDPKQPVKRGPVQIEIHRQDAPRATGSRRGRQVSNQCTDAFAWTRTGDPQRAQSLRRFAIWPANAA